MAVENKKHTIQSDIPVQKEGYKSLLEMGPLILFFVVNYFSFLTLNLGFKRINLLI